MLAMYAELVFTTFINADEFTESELPAPVKSNDKSCKMKLSELEVIIISSFQD